MANRIKGITVEIGGDTTGLDKALKGVNSSISKTQSALNDVNRLLKLDPTNTVLVAQKQELLTQAISQTEEKLSALEAAQEQVAAAFQRGDIGVDKYQAFQREIEETRGKLNKYKSDLPGLQTEQDSLSTNTARLEKLFAATGTEVDDYADILGSQLVSAIKNGYGLLRPAQSGLIEKRESGHRRESGRKAAYGCAGYGGRRRGPAKSH